MKSADLTESRKLLPAERLLAIFEGGKPDVMPWFADLTYWYNAHEYMGKLPQKYRGEQRIRLYRELGCGAHEELCLNVVNIKYKRTVVKNWVEKGTDGSLFLRTRYITPIGELEVISKFSIKSFSWATIKYAIEKPTDLKILRFIEEDKIIEPNQEAYERQLRLIEKWNGWGIVSSIPPRTPFSRLLIEWCGFFNTYRLYWKAKEDLEETINLMAEADNPIYDAIGESPAKFVYFGENLSSDIVSPKIFRRYYMDYYRKRAVQLHAKGKFIYVHIDGRLKGLLPLLHETGVDCAQSLTPSPVGDVPLKEFRRLAGPDIILWGGLPGVYFSKVYPERLLRKLVFEIIDMYLRDRKFIIGVADQVPPDADIRRVRIVTDIVEEYGKY